jgi:threonine efflux protein
MQYLPLILTVASLHLLAVMSPGPDFIMISRNSLVYSRRNGVWSAIGLGLGILLHVTYCLIGLGLLIERSVLLFSVIKVVGAAYLIYIGAKAMRAKRVKATEITEPKPPLSDMAALRMGFLTNATNPKATLFFLSIFTLVITPHTPLAVKVFMGAEMSLATMAWFSLVAALLSHRRIKDRFTGIQHYIERGMGGILVLLGLKLATSTAK